MGAETWQMRMSRSYKSLGRSFHREGVTSALSLGEGRTWSSVQKTKWKMQWRQKVIICEVCTAGLCFDHAEHIVGFQFYFKGNRKPLVGFNQEIGMAWFPFFFFFERSFWLIYGKQMTQRVHNQKWQNSSCWARKGSRKTLKFGA